MTIDILLSTALRGGVERIIQMLHETIEGPDTHFRIVQLVWEGERWLPDSAEFYPLLNGKGEYELKAFIDAYQSFLQGHGCPDLVLATVWPYNVYVAKKALQNLGHNSKVVSWMHHGIEEYRRTGMGADEWLAYADAHLAINYGNHSALTELFPASTVYRLHNPIRFPDPAACKTNYDTESDWIRLAFVGRISAEKNLEYIFRSMSKKKDCTLDIIGTAEDPQYERSLRKLSDSLCISDRVRWLGWKSDPWADAIRADAVCLASHYEGFPLVALEALAHGLPVISSNVNGIRELILPCVTGYIFDAAYEDALFDALTEFQTHQKLADHAHTFRQTASVYDSFPALLDMKMKLLSIIGGEQLLPNSLEDPWFIETRMKKDKISVIVPCRNTESRIRSCIDALLHQSITIADLEFILVDYASDDFTHELLLRYERQHPDQVMIVSLDKYTDDASAAEIGRAYATGDYAVCVNPADTISPDLLLNFYKESFKSIS